MTTDRRQPAIAFVLSVFITLTIFSGVSSLAAPDHGAMLLAKTSLSATS